MVLARVSHLRQSNMPIPSVIVIFNKTDWPTFTRRGQVHAIASVVEKLGITVICVNRPLCPVTTAFRKLSRFKELFGRSRLRQLSSNLYLASPKYCLSDIVAWRIPAIERANIRMLQRWYRDVAARLQLGDAPPLVWYYHPVQAYVARVFPKSPVVYEMYDLLADVSDHPNVSALSLESKYREDVDVMLAVSPKLLQDYGKNYKTAWLSGNGLPKTTLEQLTSDSVPLNPLIESIPRPRLGYAGNISDRLDWPLLRELIIQNPEWQFVFVGRQQNNILSERLGAPKNLHYLGEVSQNDIAGIVAGFDVGILPYIPSDFIDHSNPLKFYEHAAAGVPTVSCPNDMLSTFASELVKTVPADAAKWKSAISAALSIDRAKLRKTCREFSASYTWEAISTRVIDSLVEKLS